MDNYEKAAQNAKNYFLSYDQDALIRKLNLNWDSRYLYIPMLSELHRLCRKTGDLQKKEGKNWESANSFEEELTVLDYVCDCRENRYLSGRWKITQEFGHRFHNSLLEPSQDPLADFFNENPDAFQDACREAGGVPVQWGDMGFSVPLFPDVPVGVFFWQGDQEFPARLRFFWDENAGMYLKYETMHYGISLIRNRLGRHLQKL